MTARRARLKKIEDALRIAVPELKNLTDIRDEKGLPHPLTTVYQARVRLDASDETLRAGTRGRAKIQADPQSLGQRLLRFLAERPGLALSRQQILDGVWGYDWFGDTRTVDVHILRSNPAKDDFKHSTILTLSTRFLACI